MAAGALAKVLASLVAMSLLGSAPRARPALWPGLLHGSSASQLPHPPWSATSNVQLAVASTDCNWFTSSSGCTPGPLDHDRPSECPIPTRIANDSLGRLLPCHSGTPHHFPPIKGNIRWKHLQLPVGASPPPTASTLHPPRPPDPPSRPKRAPFRDDDLCPDPEGAHDSPASLVHELGQPKVRQKQAGASPPPPAPASSTLRPPEPPFRPQHTPFDDDGPCPHPGGARDNAALLGLQTWTTQGSVQAQ